MSTGKMVNKFQYKIELIEYRDLMSHDEWHIPGEVTKDSMSCTSIGFVVHEDDDIVEITSTIDNYDKCCCSMIILKSVIKSRKIIKL